VGVCVALIEKLDTSCPLSPPSSNQGFWKNREQGVIIAAFGHGVLSCFPSERGAGGRGGVYCVFNVPTLSFLDFSFSLLPPLGASRPRTL
jgi:hypothetical protein